MFHRHFSWDRVNRNADTGGGNGGSAPAGDGGAAAPAAPASAPAAGASAPAAAPAAAPAKDGGQQPAQPAAAAPSSGVVRLNDQLAKAGEGAKPNTEGQKPEGEAGKEGEGQQKPGEQQQAQPVVYQDFTVPAEYQASPEAMELAKGIFGELNLKQEDAQKVVDAYFKVDQMVNAAFIQDIEKQFTDFQSDAEFYDKVNSKLTPQAEQAYGVVRNHSANISSFFEFLNKNGGMFHPGFAEIVKALAPGWKEAGLKNGEGPGQNEEAWKNFYSKSNHV